MYRRRAVVRDRRARPAADLTVGDSGGRLCYVVVANHGRGISVGLEEDQVAELIAALVDWQRDRVSDLQPYGRPSSFAQSPAGLAGRS